ncbi:prepilin-type N-terminal cleavage/methylation domain-containing protein [Vibrio nigripulchritudo]|uniref:type IV pilus modification PilV family protein n=1 Tax=Vibrio nigripulchritudo TaxID=28173 RepID=UPI0003B1ABFB|nr:prepilin-type N-terminal cleavage/methylation domain-containing protein [Vibrio nigripulchritudo]CCN71803.1 putative MSHA pilin protein MshD [Vibrio nigripulchritudo SFn118]
MAVKAKGFTLIESVIAILVLGISMSVLLTILFPRVENSASSQYQVRASILAQSMMTEILARGFDDNSDPNGGIVRCDETGATSCTTTLDAETGETPETYNDVDDYVGCWYTNNASECSAGVTAKGNLNDIFGDDISSDYRNFRVEVSVVYDPDSRFGFTDSLNRYKKITLTVFAGKYGEYNFRAYRGNY